MNIKSCLNRNLLIFILILAFCLDTLPVHSQSWESWAKPVPVEHKAPETRKNGKKSATFYSAALKGYQSNVSPKQGPKCPAYPSCSSYTLSAMNNYGFLMGFIMGLDRIYFRENFEMKYLKHYNPVILPGNLAKVYDPVEANNIFRKKDWTVLDPDFSFSGRPR
jgi:uncharacterized protein